MRLLSQFVTVLGVIAILSLVNAPVAWTQEPVADLVQTGKNCLDSGQLARAIDAFTKAIEVDSGYAEAYHLRAKAFFNVKEYERTIDDCSSLLALRPDAVDGYFYHGCALLSLGELRRSLSDFSKVIELNPDVPDGYVMRATVRANLSDYDGSMVDCTDAIRLSPESAFLYFFRATSAVRAEDYDGAIGDLKRVLDLEPKRADCYYLLGVAYAQQQKYDTAIVCTERAVADTGIRAAALRNLGFLSLVKDDAASAISNFSRSIDADTTRDRCRAMLGLAAVYHQMHNPGESEIWVNRAREIQPNLALNKDVLVGFERVQLLGIEKIAYQKALNPF
jgi:tetratricopeptide (TPR) repeat protein